MSVIELQTYDVTGPSVLDTTESLCQECLHKGKSFLCLIIKKGQYPAVTDCQDFTPK